MADRAWWLRVIDASRPIYVLGAAVLYALGAGIAAYLGYAIDWPIYLLGQGLVTTIQLGGHFLNAAVDAGQSRENSHPTPFSGGTGHVGNGAGDAAFTRDQLRSFALGCFSVALVFLLSIIWAGSRNPLVVGTALVAFLVAIFYSSAPVRLSASGYGELAVSVLVANLTPAFGFLLQTDELHRLLAMSTFPLTVLHLAMMLAFQLPDYAADLHHQKRTLMVRLGWQMGMALHDGLIIAAYLMMGLAVIQGMPLPIAIPPLLTLPLAGLQIWQMRQIANGARPNYTALTLTPAALFAAVAYLFAFSFWTR